MFRKKTQELQRRERGCRVAKAESQSNCQLSGPSWWLWRDDVLGASHRCANVCPFFFFFLSFSFFLDFARFCRVALGVDVVVVSGEERVCFVALLFSLLAVVFRVL